MCFLGVKSKNARKAKKESAEKKTTRSDKQLIEKRETKKLAV